MCVRERGQNGWGPSQPERGRGPRKAPGNGGDGEDRRAGRETSGTGIGAEPAVSVCLKEKNVNWL